MESSGKCLKAERDLRNLSLEEVAKSTKIRKRFLVAIEEDRYELLPPGVYIKGFLAVYARYLGLNPKDIILRYQKYVESKTPSKGPELKQRLTSSKLKQWITFLKKGGNLWLLITPICVIILFIAIFIYRILFNPGHEFLPLYGKKEPTFSPLPSVPSSLPIQKEVKTRTINPSERSQTPQSMDTNLKDGILPESLQFKVLEAGLGTGIERKDDFLILTGKCSEFGCNNQRAYFVTKIQTKKEGKIIHVWLRNGKEFQKNEIETKAPQWTVYSFITLRVGHEGDWKVEVRHEDKVLTSLSFKAIEPSFHSTPKTH